MAAPQRVVQAIQAGIVASAHLAALESVSAAAHACQRLGGLTSGRWRSAARNLGSLEEDLQRGFTSVAEALIARAEESGVPEETLWTVGDAAGTLDMLRDAALDEVGEGDARTVKVLESEVLFGASFVEDSELPDRGTTLLFTWPEPLAPASWAWQANWVVGDADNDGQADELDLFEAGGLETDAALLGELASELSFSAEETREGLRNAALALTRASLLANVAGEDEEEEEEEGDEATGAP